MCHEVILEESLGLPPNKEIGFYINSIPRARLISITPYCIVSTKLVELDNQLNILLDKGLSRLVLHLGKF